MTESEVVEVVSGDHRMSDLGNAVSDAIHAALVAGLEIDEATSVVVQVAVDYGVGEYGPRFAEGLAAVALSRLPPRPTGQRA